MQRVILLRKWDEKSARSEGWAQTDTHANDFGRKKREAARRGRGKKGVTKKEKER